MNNAQIQKTIKQLYQSRVAIFVFVVMLVYIFIAWRIDVLAGVEPSQSAIDSQVSATSSPHIDKATVTKVRQLQDNSVNVQALFNDARNNPFQE